MIRNFISKLYSLYTPSFFISGGGSAGGYVIERSLRFSAVSSQYLTRLPSVASNRGTWTWSGWVKRGTLGAIQTFFCTNYVTGGNDNGTDFRFDTNDALTLIIANNPGGIGICTITTTRLFRDVSAYYHIVVRYDTTQSTASDRVSLYVNGERITSFSVSSYPPLNNNTATVNNTQNHHIGCLFLNGSPTRYFDGYLSENNFIDGQALTPSNFGEINQSTGQWVAKKYTGTYGTNGFYLDFKDGTSTTTLGQDKSGNNNHWTLTNFTRSAGVNDCWMLDVPSGNSSASAVQPSANYAVISPLFNTAGYLTVSKSNLQVSIGGMDKVAMGTIAFPTSGKYYYEYTVTTVGSNSVVGVADYSSIIQSSGLGWSGSIRGYQQTGNKFNGTAGVAYGASFTTGDLIGVAVDMDAGTITFYKNNVSQGVAYSDLTGTTWLPSVYINSATGNFNFGQRSFAYTPPTGFKALCTANLTSTDVIESGSFTGNASANGPFIWCNGTPETLTINGNAVTWGTHADRLSNGFKLRTSSSSYNSSGTNTWTATILSPESKSAFKHQNAKGN